MAYEKEIDDARDVAKYAYAPYSGFKVGCALYKDGRLFSMGVNVENASYGLTLCAERAALARVVTVGHPLDMGVGVVLVIYADAEKPAMPCGACRQWMIELIPNATVVSATDNAVEVATVRALLPQPFVLEVSDGNAPV